MDQQRKEIVPRRKKGQKNNRYEMKCEKQISEGRGREGRERNYA